VKPVSSFLDILSRPQTPKTVFSTDSAHKNEIEHFTFDYTKFLPEQKGAVKVSSNVTLCSTELPRNFVEAGNLRGHCFISSALIAARSSGNKE